MVWVLFLFTPLFLAMTPVSLKDILIDLERVLAALTRINGPDYPALDSGAKRRNLYWDEEDTC
ncbi:MAG: hypothetical protein CFH10_01064 [Alphaproteobacteria bacterium MarineAlpha4_Bin2]|nr:MAG: hypothetical protein CFH10_01064 [Alphaproteobacteria bacterium MarineAlpha4_Bin2]